MLHYLEELGTSFGRGWNRFWFTPVDPLPLCAVRVLAGLLLLYSHTAYGFDLTALFASDGLLTVDTVRNLRVLDASIEPNGRAPVSFSYLYLLSSPTMLWAAHAAGYVVIVALIAGLFSRVSAVLALVVALSYLHRAPIFTGEFDRVLVAVLFYLCIGPCGARLSVDAWLARRAGRSVVEKSWLANIALRLLQIHLGLIFLMMAIAKLSGPNPPAVWWTGDGIWWLMAKPETRPWDATSIARWPESRLLLDAMTHAVVLIELAYGLLIWNRMARPIVLGLLLLVWAPILALATGMFGLVGILLAASLAFLPAETLRGDFAGQAA